MKGVRRTKSGWQVYARVHGRFYSRHLPPQTSQRRLESEREHLKAVARFGVPAPADARTFRDDARDYLELVQHMPSFKDRAYHIAQWVDVFGPRLRSSITAKDIRAVLETWRTTGRVDGGPLSVASLNRRRTALMHLYTTLDGKAVPNIVKDVPAYSEHYSQRARAESMVTCARLIKRLRPGGRMRAFLHALLWTGWPPKLLSQLRPEHIDYAGGRVLVPTREKGRGMAGGWVPVVPRALLALRQMGRVNAWGGCSTSSMHTALARAVQRENAWRLPRGLPPVASPFGPYVLRHSFATWAAARVKDDRALRELLRTNSIARYTGGALEARMLAAREALVARRKVAKELQPAAQAAKTRRKRQN